VNSDNTPRVTEILRGAGLIDFSMVPASIMAPAQRFGSAVHKATELCDKGTLDIDILSEPLIPYLDGWKKFITDYNITIKPDEIERQFISKIWGFKGTPDRWPLVGNKRTLIDLKSSTSMYPATAIQTAAYQILLEENGIKIQQRWGVQLNNKGTYKIEVYKKISDRTVFLSALNIYKWKGENL
jgi:hypothetical protein